MKIKSISLLIVLLVIFIVLFNCNKITPKKHSTKTLIFGVGSKLNKLAELVPYNTYLIQLIPIKSLLYMKILSRNENEMNSNSAIKRIEKDKNKVIFYLKENLYFSNGERIYAKDVVNSILKSLNSNVNDQIINTLINIIKGAREFIAKKTKYCEGIKVINKNSFSIEFIKNKPDFKSYFQSLTTAITYNKWNNNWNGKEKITSGMFFIKDLKVLKDRKILTIMKNPYYKLKKININKIIFYFYNNTATLLKDIHNKSIDVFYLLNQTKKSITKDYDYIKIPLTGNFYILLNPMRKPFSNKRLRLFFNYYLRSIDFNSILKNDFAFRADTITPFGIINKNLFKKYEIKDFRNYIPKKKISLNLNLYYYGIRKELFTYMKKDLKKYNIDINFKFISNKEWSKNLQNGNYKLTSFYYLMTAFNAMDFFKLTIYNNFGLRKLGYKNEKALSIIKKYEKETDEFKKLKLIWELEKIFRKESFLIPLINPITIFGYKKNIKGMSMNKFYEITLKDVKIEKIKIN